MTLKDNWHEFMAVLDRHGITKLYHFTDRDNLQSIINNGGLYSWADCENKGINIAKPGGDSQSRSLDSRDGLQNYVRVCFTRQHPMMFVAMNDGRISDPVILEIDPEVVYWKGTKYADRNATKTGVRIGSDINALKRIHFQSVKADKHFDLDVDEQPFFQAEILVPNCIPLEYITNISDFSLPIPSTPQNAEISEFKIDQDLSTKVTDEDIRNGIKDEFGAIYSPDGKRLLKGANIESYRIREGTIVICNYSPCQMFYHCNILMSVTIPNSVTKIGWRAFEGCSGLKQVHIKDIAAWCNINFIGLNSNPLSIAHHFYINDNETKDLVIPDSVTKIGAGAFGGCSGLTSVTIPNSVTEIGGSAFEGCSGLTSVTIPNSVTEIGDSAFSHCSGLTSITIPDSVTEIGDRAFSGCTELTSVTIGNSVTKIGNSTFSNCRNLTSITISDSVTEIGEEAFEGCRGLTSVTIGSSVTKIGRDAFNGCDRLKQVHITDIATWCNIIFIGLNSNPLSIANHFYINNNEIKDLVIPNSVTKIGDWAFSYCSGLTSITIPDSVIEIGDRAFLYCSELTSIHIPNSVEIISPFAFCNCSGIMSVTIGKSVTEIGEDAFSGCSGLASIVVEQGNTNYDSRNNCNAIIETSSDTLLFGSNSTIIPDSVTEIGYRAFEGCSGLTSITIPDSVTAIGENAFNRSGLTSITIGNSVTWIGDWAFKGCSGLTSVVWNVKNYDDFSSYIHAPFGGLTGIKTFTFGDEVERIPAYLCYGLSGLTSVTIPNSVTEIGEKAFSRCSGLTSITIPDSVTEIGDWAFLLCSGLTSVVWNANNCAVVKSGICLINAPFNGLFNNLTRIRTFSFGDEVERIPANLCRGLSGLTSITIPDSVTRIGDYAFSNCSGLTSVTIPNSVIKIGDFAFSDCSGMASIVVEQGNTNYDSRNNCNAIIKTASNTLLRGCKSTIIPNSVTKICNNAFSDCNELTSITIPNSVTSIGRTAFYGCSRLISIVIPDSVTEIGDYAFSNCSGLTSVTIPDSVTEIGRNAFNGCNNLTSIRVQKGSIEKFINLLPKNLHNLITEL